MTRVQSLKHGQFMSKQTVYNPYNTFIFLVFLTDY
jgi:hypothetical protein